MLIENQEEMVNELNSFFFVPIGSNLAKEMTCKEPLKDVCKGENRITQSMFLAEVSESEILLYL